MNPILAPRICDLNSKNKTRVQTQILHIFSISYFFIFYSLKVRCRFCVLFNRYAPKEQALLSSIWFLPLEEIIFLNSLSFEGFAIQRKNQQIQIKTAFLLKGFMIWKILMIIFRWKNSDLWFKSFFFLKVHIRICDSNFLIVDLQTVVAPTEWLDLKNPKIWKEDSSKFSWSYYCIFPFHCSK